MAHNLLCGMAAQRLSTGELVTQESSWNLGNPSVPISFRNEISISSRDCTRSNQDLIGHHGPTLEGLGIPAGSLPSS